MNAEKVKRLLEGFPSGVSAAPKGHEGNGSSTWADPRPDTTPRLHEELVHPNPGRFPTWRACLEANGLLTQEAVEYSRKRGWRVE